MRKTKIMAEFQIETGPLQESALTVQAEIRMREEGGLFPMFTPEGGKFPFGTNPFAQKPVSIIQADQELYLEFHCKAEGFLPQFLPPTGHWHLTVLFEKMGPGEGPANLVFNSPNVALTTVPWSHKIVVPAGYFTGFPPHETGANVYRIVATMVWHNAADVITPIAGFADVGMLQVYED